MIPDAYFARFETKKYRNDNPVQRALIRRFATSLHDLVLEAGEVFVGDHRSSSRMGSSSAPRLWFW